MATLVPEDTEVLAGLEFGGVPVATALSLATGIPAAFVRKELHVGDENVTSSARDAMSVERHRPSTSAAASRRSLFYEREGWRPDPGLPPAHNGCFPLIYYTRDLGS